MMEFVAHHGHSAVIAFAISQGTQLMTSAGCCNHFCYLRKFCHSCFCKFAEFDTIASCNLLSTLRLILASSRHASQLLSQAGNLSCFLLWVHKLIALTLMSLWNALHLPLHTFASLSWSQLQCMAVLCDCSFLSLKTLWLLLQTLHCHCDCCGNMQICIAITFRDYGRW